MKIANKHYVVIDEKNGEAVIVRYASQDDFVIYDRDASATALVMRYWSTRPKMLKMSLQRLLSIGAPQGQTQIELL